jgi:hypothetical protein
MKFFDALKNNLSDVQFKYLYFILKYKGEPFTSTEYILDQNSIDNGLNFLKENVA